MDLATEEHHMLVKLLLLVALVSGFLFHDSLFAKKNTRPMIERVEDTKVRIVKKSVKKPAKKSNKKKSKKQLAKKSKPKSKAKKSLKE